MAYLKEKGKGDFMQYAFYYLIHNFMQILYSTE